MTEDKSTVTGQSTKGDSVTETGKRVKQTENEGKMADRAAVQKGMMGLAERAKAGREITRRRQSLGEGNVDFGDLGRVAPGKKVSMSKGKSMGGSRA